jgi:hypothetical protein
MKKNAIRCCLPPYQDYRSSGPYLRPDQGNRLFINLLGDWGKYKTKTMLYARYLLTVHLGRTLPDGYDVDHIDGNPYNDTTPNLQALPHCNNLSKSKKDPRTLFLQKKVSMVCPHCSTPFIKRKGDTHLTKGGNSTFCSRECSYHSKKYIGVHQEYTVLEMETPDITIKTDPWEEKSSPCTQGRKRIVPLRYSLTCSSCEKAFLSSNRRTKDCSKDCEDARKDRKKESCSKLTDHT